MRKLYLSLCAIFLLFTAHSQTILINPAGDGGFESGADFAANGWTVVNGSVTNKWFVGAASTPFSGSRAAYIDNGTGITNAYTNTSAGTVHFYRDVSFPAGEGNILLTFKWKAQGEGNYDYITVFSMPTSLTPAVNSPAAGNSSWNNITTAYPGAVVHSTPPNLNLQSSYQTQTICLPAAYAGTTRRLVFMWSNDGSAGSQPPGSVDDITLITSATPFAAPASAATGLVLTATSTSQINGTFTAAAGNPAGYLVVRYPAGATPVVPVNGNSYSPGTVIGSNGMVVSSGSATSFSATGLTGGTNYDFYVYAYNYTCTGVEYGATALSGSQATQACAGLTPGTYSVGPTGTYPTLTAAIAATSVGAAGTVIFELQPAYTSATEPAFPITISSGACPVNSLIIRPAAGATNLQITSNNATATIDMNGAKNVTIDGRPGGAGTISQLSVINTAGNGVAVRFINESSNNTLTYTDLQGQNTVAPATGTVTSAGVVYFSNTTGISGNDNNTLSNCSIHGTATGNPAVGIFSIGSTGTVAAYNDNGVITNCNIYDFFSAGSASSGVKLDAGNNAWTLSDNSVYQTASRVYTTSNTHRAFWITPNTGTISNTASGFVITGNFIGGTTAGAGGTPYTMSGSVASIFNAMDISAGLGTPTSVQNNTIKNFAISTTSGAGFIGISQANGNVDIGTTTGNTIGATTGNSSITVTTTATGGGTVIGYRATSGTGTTVNIANNNFGAVTTNGTATLGVNIIGINVTGGNIINVSNNVIGSTTTANSINASASTTGNTQSVTGISVTGGNNTLVIGNTIANMNNNYTGTGAGVMRGIIATSSLTSISGNTVSNLSSSSATPGTGSNSAITGIAMTATTGAVNVTGNTIHSLSLTSASTTAATQITGLYYSGSTSAVSEISKNFIHSFDVTAVNTNVTLTGIDYASATATVSNNMIRLGIRPNGTSLSTETIIRGISANSTSSINNFYFNSIYIGGTGVGTVVKSTYAFIRTTGSGIYDIRNNIFDNARANAAAGGNHYAVYLTTAATGVSIDYNIYFSTSIFAYNGADIATYAPNWVPGDVHSFYLDPLFVLPNGTATTVDLHLQTGTIAEGTGIAIPAITDDIDNQLRNSLTPTDIGADAGNFGYSGPDVGVTLLVTPASGVCYGATETVTVRIKNFSSNTLDLATSNVTVTASATGPVSYTSSIVLSSGTLAPGATMDVTLPLTINMSAAGTYVFTASTSLAGDLNGFNNAISGDSRLVGTSLGGAYNVGAGQAASGGFNTLKDAVAAYNNATCLNGNVIFNLTDASYTTATGEIFPVTINGLTNYTGPNTLTIKPAAGNTAIISASNTTAVIDFNGSKNVILDGSNNGTTSKDLTISNTNTGGSVIRFINGANNNIVKNNVLTGVSTSTSNGVVFFATTTTGTGNNNNTIQNNNITKGTTAYAYGIFNSGTTTNSFTKNTANLITGNRIFDFSNTGIRDGGGSAGNTYILNEIFQTASQTSVLTGFGVASTSIEGFTFTRNRIFDMKTTATGVTYGIFLSDAAVSPTPLISNNMVALGETAPLTLYGIYDNTATTEFYNIYHNTVSISGTVTGASNSAAYYRITASNTDLRNNIFSNTRTGGTGKHYAIRTTTPLSSLNSDYNDIYNSGGTANVFGYDGTADRANLAAWQAATGKDANSVSIQPEFVSPVDLHLIAGLNIALNDLGTPIPAVPIDFDGQARSAATPDMGADEFTPPVGVDVVASTLVAPASQSCYSNAETVSVSIKNFSPNLLDFSASPVTVTLNVTGAVTQTFSKVLNTGTLNSGDSLIVTFATTLNMSTVGTYNFAASATSPADINTSNDAMAPQTRTLAALAAGTVSSTQSELCVSGTPTLSLTGNAGGAIQWQESSSALGPWNNVGTGTTSYTPSTPVTTGMYYQAVLSCNSSSATSNVFNIAVNNPQVLTTGPGTRCGPGTAMLTATASAGATLNWYTTPTGGIPVGTGNIFTTPIINTNTTYYVAAAIGGSTISVGLPNNGAYGTFGDPGASGYGLYFTTSAPITINSVYVYPQEAGTSTIRLRTGTGTDIPGASVTVTFTAADINVKTLVPLGFNIPSAGSYRLMNTAGASLGRFNTYTGPAYPLNYGPVTLTQGSGGTNTYYSFFDWSVFTGCESPRQAVLATISPAPALGLTGNTTICNNAVLPLTVTTPLTNFDTYTWAPLTGLFTDAAGTIPYTGTSASTVYIKNATGGTYTYVATANQLSTSCQNIDSVKITVLPANITISASTTQICTSGTSILSLNPGTGYGSGSFQWYSSPNGTTYTAIPTAIGGTYTTPVLTATTYYKADIKNDAGTVCQSPTVTVTVNSPQILTTTPAARCGAGTVTLTATSSAGTTIRWYSAAAGGAPIATGASLTTPSLAATTTYYVAAENGIPPIGLGASNSTSYESPFYHLYGGKKSQYLVRASELTAIGLTAGPINSLGFNVVTAGVSYNTFSISMKNTAAAVMTTTMETGLTTVYTAPSVTPVVGLNMYSFQTPFNWDGTSNVIVEVCWSNNNTGGTTATVKMDATSFVSHAYFRVDSEPQSVVCPTTAATNTSSLRPQMVFGAYCSGNRVAVTATISGNTAITAQPTAQAACVGGSASLSVTATGSGLTYQWRKNGAAISIPGATTNAITISPLVVGDAGLYDVVITGLCGTVTSTAVNLVVASGNSWIGVTNTDWSNPSNWCGGVPTSATDVTIPANTPNAPVISSLADVRNITINSGASLTVTASGTLNIFGNYANSGTFTATSGLVIFKGAVNQNVGAISAGTILLNGAGITLTGNMTVGNTLILTNGNITLGNNNITLNGSFDGTAASHIVTNGTGSVISNNITTSAVTIPIGADATSYNPVIISNGQGRNYTVRVAPGINPGGVLNAGRAINRTWNITPSSAVTTPVNIVLQYADADAIAPASPTLIMEAAVHNGTQWNVISPATGITPSGLPSARQVGISTTQFGPTIIGNIGTLTNPTATPNIDPDINRIVLMPNLVQGNTVLRVQSRRSMKITWSVIDAQGRVVMRFQNAVYAGQTDLPLNFAPLAGGHYYLIGNTEKGKTQLLKFIRQ